MTFVAKTSYSYPTEEVMAMARTVMPWKAFLDTLGGTDSSDQTVIEGTTVTRKWTDKIRAQQYVDWVTAQSERLGIPIVDLKLEDYSE